MKAWGWIILVLGILNFLVGILGVAMGETTASSYFGGGIAFCVLGGYLQHRAKQKEEEKQHHDNWNNE